MPKKAEEALKRTARKKFPGNKERQDRYVYGSALMQKHRKKKHGKTK